MAASSESQVVSLLEGIAMAPDGRSFVTSVGAEQREIWFHDGRQERRISSEGFASNPQFSADGRRIYYVLRSGENEMRMGFVSGELLSKPGGVVSRKVSCDGALPSISMPTSLRAASIRAGRRDPGDDEPVGSGMESRRPGGVERRVNIVVK